jgi:hypothetical protein
MSKESPFDIFSSSGKKPLKSGAKKPSKPPTPPPAPPPPEESKDNMQPKGKLDPQVSKMLEEIFEMQQDLQKKIDKIFEKTGMSKLEIERFLKNPRNYPPGKWEKILHKKQLLEEQINQVLRINKKEKAEQDAAKTSKDRKSKFLAGRKKWIPIR